MNLTPHRMIRPSRICLSVGILAMALAGCTTVRQKHAPPPPRAATPITDLQGTGYLSPMPGAPSSATRQVAQAANVEGHARVGTIGTGAQAGNPAAGSVVSPDSYAAGDAAYWSGSGATNVAPSDLSLQSLQADSLHDWMKKGVISSQRATAIRDAAAALGAQAGLHARAAAIQKALKVHARQYDHVFNFSVLMLQPGFLPPVITEARDTYRQESPNVARASDLVFKIERPARIVSAPPSWRVYLLADPPPVAKPSSATLPKTKAEKELWNAWVAKGWKRGVKLANANFQANLARLRRDYNGMLRYKMLYEQGLVSKPILARAKLGVTGGGDEMAINDRIIRITRKAALDANKKNWSGKEPRTAISDPSSP